VVVRGSNFYRAFQLADCVVRKPDIAKAMGKYMTKTNKILLIFSVIAVIVIIFILRDCMNHPKEQTTTIDSTSFYKVQIISIQAQGEAKLKRWRQDSLSMEARNTALKTEATAARKVADKALKKIAVIVQSNPDVKDFIEKDSTADRINEERIIALELDKVKITTSFFDILHSKDEEIKVSKELTVHLESTIAELKQDLRKEKNKKLFWKVAFGIAVGGIVFQSFN